MRQTGCRLLGAIVCFFVAFFGISVLAEESIYPLGPQAFDPSNPSQHGTWKGRKTLPLDEMQVLCAKIAAYLELPQENCCNLLLEICAAESDFGYYVRQVRGPAQSVWQIEPATARDLHTRLPKKNLQLYTKIVALRDPLLDEEENVVTNLNYGAALCLGVLYLKGLPFASLNSLEARAQAWKKYYNTYLGKGTLEGYCQKALKYVGGQLNPSFQFAEPFDRQLVAQKENIFQARDNERYLSLPQDFAHTPMGRYYLHLLQVKPEVFAEIPLILLQQQEVKVIMQTFTMELMRKLQKDPAAIAKYHDMPAEIFEPLVHVAMRENALKCYPNLPPSYQARPDLQRLYQSQKFVQERLQRKQ
ncbi:MAG: hypothetical protein IJU79_02910 [Desulfovibrionaceae bacterium]|nr:hypothetical protein [Desulfovibrionaceae bacterium]